MSRRAARRRRNWPSLLLWPLAGFLGVSVALVAGLRWLHPPTSAFMLRSAWLGQEVRYHWLPWRRLSPQLAIAAVAAEDQRVPEHWGVDLGAIQKAIEEHFAGHRLRGGSTISQQVAKNLFLWPGRSYLRKGLEAYFTLLIELLWPKTRILEVYLNIAEFGPGVFGAGAAARVYFKTEADRLTAAQSALMMSVLPSPETMRLAAPSAYMRERARWIRQQMIQLGGPAYLSRLD